MAGNLERYRPRMRGFIFQEQGGAEKCGRAGGLILCGLRACIGFLGGEMCASNGTMVISFEFLFLGGMNFFF